MRLVKQLVIKLMDIIRWVRRRGLAEQEFPVDVVLEDISRRSRLIRFTKTRLIEPTGTGIRHEEFFRSGKSRSAFLVGTHFNLDSVDGLQEILRDAAGNETSRTCEFTELIDREDTVTDQLCLCGCKVWEDETRAIAENDGGGEVDGLEVLGFSGGG